MPNFWSAIIARPGMMKSPSVAAIMAPIHHLAGIATAAHEGLAKEHELDAEIYKKKRAAAANKGQRIDDPEPVEPIWRRYFTNDSSYEKLCEILRDNPNGILLHRDEIVSLLRFLDQEQNSQRAASTWLPGVGRILTIPIASDVEQSMLSGPVSPCWVPRSPA